MQDQYLKPDDLIQADREAATYGIPSYVKRQWKAHRDSALRRGIQFRFSLFQWHLWWLEALAEIGPDAKRGRRKGEYVMARRGDQGAYEHDNVYAATPGQNARDIPADVREAMTVKATTMREAIGKPRGIHLRVRGDGHPASHAVITPIGRFGSIALAAEAHGITRAGGLYRVRWKDWRLE